MDTIIELENELKIRGFSNKKIKAYKYHVSKMLTFIRKVPYNIQNEDVKFKITVQITHLINV